MAALLLFEEAPVPFWNEKIPAESLIILDQPAGNGAKVIRILSFPRNRPQSLLIPWLQAKFADFGQNSMLLVARAENAL